MRRAGAVAVALLLAASVAAPAAGEPHVRRDQEAYAEWFFPTAKPHETSWFGAFVWHDASVIDGEEVDSLAVFVRGRCVREKLPQFVFVDCIGDEFVRGDPEKHFTMSPIATDAELRIERDGQTHVVRWTAPPSTDHYVAAEKCYSSKGEKEGEGQGGGFARNATATGTFLGHRLDPSVSRAAMSTGLMFTTCPTREIDYDRATHTFHVTYRIPR